MSRINMNAVVLPHFSKGFTLVRMNQVRTLRKLKGWNQGDLANAAGVEQSYISKIENGWDGVTLRNIRFIAEALGAEAYELLMSDTTASERALLEVFRGLSPDRQKGWLEMAKLAKVDADQADQ